MSFLSLLGVGFTSFIFWKFLKQLGSSIPVLELLLLIAGLQWIVGPVISYLSSYQHYKFFMYVDEITYMYYVVPGYILFSGIILLKKKEINFSFEFVDFSYASTFGKVIFVLGVIADFLRLVAPPSLSFFLFLLSQFKYVGAGILFFTSSKTNRIYFYFTLAYLFFQALSSAMFHDFILWGVLFFMLWALKKKPSMKLKIAIIFIGILFAGSLQVVKGSFRALVWEGYSGNKLSLFIDIIFDQILNPDSNSDIEFGDLNVRLNQGWIISAVMAETPRNEPYANGSTILEAVSASFLPRFLNPDKKEAGGRENFMRFTGLFLATSTSMGLSVIGEAYANFGAFGGIIFMFFWGWFLVFYWNKLNLVILSHPLLLSFIPLLFLQVLKSETELVVVLNHLTKSTILVFLFFWFARKFLKWNI
jgi:hypothetical protein